MNPPSQRVSKETGLPLLRGEVISAGLFPIEVEVIKPEGRRDWKHLKGGWIDLIWETRHPVSFEVTTRQRRITTSAAHVKHEMKLLSLRQLRDLVSE